MKKFTKILGAAALLLCGLMITGCGAAEAIKEQLESTYDQWYKYNGTTKIDIPLGDTDDENDSSKLHDLKDVEFYVYFNATDGLKVAIQTTKQDNVELLNGLIEQTVDVTIGGVKEYPVESFGKAKWTSLTAIVPLKAVSAPKIVTSPDECVKLDNIKNYKIQWKKVLKKTLINTLLGE